MTKEQEVIKYLKESVLIYKNTIPKKKHSKKKYQNIKHYMKELYQM